MLSKSEKKSTMSIACIYSFRMFGLFIILPIFSLYSDIIIGATSTLMGMALGVYGLTQASFQVIFGILSDKYGRKPVIILGLLIFIFGGIIAAISHTIYGIIFGRALQGAGAIGSTLTAVIADTTTEENRMKAMSIIGITIGVSFLIAMSVSPILNVWIGLSGIFWLTALLGIVGIIIFIYGVPNAAIKLTPSYAEQSTTVLKQIRIILFNSELLRLNYGIFSLHAILTSLFLVFPTILIEHMEINFIKQWVIYVPVLSIAFLLMIPFIIIAETKNLMKAIFVGAIIVITITQPLLYIFNHIVTVSILLVFYFASFTLLEAALPSLVSKIAPIISKGTAMGIYSSAQFFGIFFGGSLGGIILQHFTILGIFIFNTILGILWIIVSLTMQKPKQLSSKFYSIKKQCSRKHSTTLQKKIIKITWS